jgi:signal transduction histidine kinase
MTETLRMQAGDLSRPPSRALSWILRRPMIVDALVVGAAVIPLLLATIFRGEGASRWDSESWLGYSTIALAGVALVWRRRRPLTVAAVVAVACAASPLAQPGFSYPMLPFAFAVYSVTSRQPFPRTVIVYSIGMGCTVLSTLLRQSLGLDVAIPTIVEPFSLVAIVVGLIVRGKRERHTALTDLVNERIDNAAAHERGRIAAEMHDLVAHSLSIIVALANGADAGWEKHPDRARAANGKIAEVGRDALADMQRVLSVLRSSDAALDENLHESGHNLPSLQELAKNVTAAGLPVHLSHSGPQLPDDPVLQMTVYRIVQESLTNALRHAQGATHSFVNVAVDNQEVALEITNDGLPQQWPKHRGHGLAGITQRAALLGGTSTSAPAATGGWSTHVSLPLSRATDV